MTSVVMTSASLFKTTMPADWRKRSRVWRALLRRGFSYPRFQRSTPQPRRPADRYAVVPVDGMIVRTNRVGAIWREVQRVSYVYGRIRAYRAWSGGLCVLVRSVAICGKKACGPTGALRFARASDPQRDGPELAYRRRHVTGGRFNLGRDPGRVVLRHERVDQFQQARRNGFSKAHPRSSSDMGAAGQTR